ALAQLIQQFRNTVSLSKYNYPINTEIDEMLNEKYVMADEEAYQLSLKCEPPATKSSVNNGHRYGYIRIDGCCASSYRLITQVLSATKW
ncbi:hypothetical protein SARC_16283, partial [Sphaeroforma arctica JP610]